MNISKRLKSAFYSNTTNNERNGLKAVPQSLIWGFSTSSKVWTSQDTFNKDYTYGKRLDAIKLPKKAALAVALADNSYESTIIDTPNVPADELAQAVRWAVTTQFGAGLDEMIVEYTRLPQSARRDAGKLYVFAASNDEVKSQLEPLMHWGKQLQVIDVPELCLIRALAEKLNQPDFCVLLKDGDQLQLLIAAQNRLALSRSIEIHHNDIQKTADALDTAFEDSRRWCKTHLGLSVSSTLFTFDDDFSGSHKSSAQLLPLLTCQTSIIDPPSSNGCSASIRDILIARGVALHPEMHNHV